jgi:predicted nucleic acid-binding protein
MSINHYFLDASYIISLELADDQNHINTLKHWQILDKKQLHLTTTSYIFDEVVTFLNSRNLHEKAVEIGTRLINSSVMELIHVDESLFFDGWMFFQKHNDKSYSLTDCISFVIMPRLSIKNALTFDRHFEQAGFRKLP